MTNCFQFPSILALFIANLYSAEFYLILDARYERVCEAG